MFPLGIISMFGGMLVVRSLIFGSALGLMGGITSKYMYSNFVK